MYKWGYWFEVYFQEEKKIKKQAFRSLKSAIAFAKTKDSAIIEKWTSAIAKDTTFETIGYEKGEK